MRVQIGHNLQTDRAEKGAEECCRMQPIEMDVCRFFGVFRTDVTQTLQHHYGPLIADKLTRIMESDLSRLEASIQTRLREERLLRQTSDTSRC